MHAEFSYAHFEWSFFAIHCYFHNQNMSFAEQGAWKKVALLFNEATRRFTVCILFLYRYWNAIVLLTKSATFFLQHDFINSVFPQYRGEYEQWMTTQNLRKKILHAMHFKWTTKYFSSYIKKYQTGTYFFGWVYLTN